MSDYRYATLCRVDPAHLAGLIDAALVIREQEIRADLYKIAEKWVIKPGWFRKGVTLEDRLACIAKFSERNDKGRMIRPNIEDPFENDVAFRLMRGSAWWDQLVQLRTSINAGLKEVYLSADLYAFLNDKLESKDA